MFEKLEPKNFLIQKGFNLEKAKMTIKIKTYDWFYLTFLWDKLDLKPSEKLKIEVKGRIIVFRKN